MNNSKILTRPERAGKENETMLRKIITHAFTITLLLFLIRLALPQYLKYLLFPSVALFGILTLTEFILSKRWQQISLKSYRFFIPLVLLLFAYFFAFFQTPYHAETLFKDTFNLLVLSAFIISALLFDFKTDELHYSLKRFKILAVIFSFLFALAGILKLYFMLKGNKWEFLSVDGLGFPQGTSLGIDDNFFTLVCVVGILIATTYLFKDLKRWQGVVLQLTLWVLVVNIMLATSRRGLIIGSLFLAGAVLLWVVSWMHKTERLRCFRRNTTLFILFTGLSFLGYYQFVFRTSALERNKWLANSRFNKEEFSIYLNLLTLNGQSIFKGNAVYDEVRKQIWQTEFDPRYPYTGWASGNYELVEELQGRNAEFVPKDALGAKIDKNTKAYTGKDYAYYQSKLFDGELVEGKRYISSVYCYVSEDFNGSSVRLISRNDARGLRDWFYDMGKKGTWQKLQNSFYGDSGRFSFSIYMVHENSQSFDSLQGHVIFAYPELKTVDFNPAQPITWMEKQFVATSEIPGSNAELLPEGAEAASMARNTFYFDQKYSQWVASTNILHPPYNGDLRYIPSVYAYVSDDFDGTGVYLQAGGGSFGFTRSGYNLKNRGTWQKLYLSFGMFERQAAVSLSVRKETSSPVDSIRGEVLFAYPEMETLQFDPRNPLTWAGTNFKREYPIGGEHSEIVPKSSAGYRIDSESQSSTYKDYSYSSTVIYKRRLERGKRYITSVYAYVSPDFDGENVRLSAGGKYLGYRACYYDMERKGQWQKLTINSYGEEGEEYYANLYFDYRKGTSFSRLKGHVVFAYPTYSVVPNNPKNPVSYAASDFKRDYPLTGENSAIVPDGTAGCRFDATTQGRVWRSQFHSTTDFQQAQVVRGDSVFASVYCFVSPDFNGNDVRLELRGPVKGQTLSRFNLNERGRWVKLEAKAIADNEGIVSGIFLFMQNNVKDFSTLKGYVTFAYPQLYVKPKAGLSYLDTHHHVNMAGFAGLGLQLGAAVDSTSSNGEFKFSMADDGFAGPRLDRWRYATHLFMNEYSFPQKLLGGGFTYTIKFARKFHPDEPQRDYDYPHNPFLSVLLYSGLVGLLVYLWFFAKTLYLYYIYRKEYWLFGLIFIVTFFYSFFSSNSPFEPAFFGVMSFLPYLIHYTKKSRKDYQ